MRAAVKPAIRKRWAAASVLLTAVMLLAVTPAVAAPETTAGDSEAASLAESFAARRAGELAANSGAAEENLLRAQDAARQANWEEARVRSEAVLALVPEHPEAKKLLQQCRQELAKKAAPAAVAPATEPAVSEAERMLSWARELLGQGDFAGARAAAEKVIALEAPANVCAQARGVIRQADAKEEEAKERKQTQVMESQDQRFLKQIDRAWLVPPSLEMGAVTAERKEEAEKKTIVWAEVERKLEQQVEVDFNQIHLREAIQNLNDAYGINLVLDELIFYDESEEILANGLSPLVTVYLKDLSLREALEIILRTKQLKFRIEENLVWITSKENLISEKPVTRIFHLSTNIENVEQIVRSSVPVWAEGETGIKYDINSNTLVVTQVPIYLEVIEDIVRTLDITPVQIAIQTRFIEIEDSALKELSVSLNDLSSYGFKLLDSDRFDLGFDSQFTGASSGAQGGRIRLDYWRLNDIAFWAVVEALEGSNRSKLLSAPHVTTLNNTQAVIRVVKPLRYPTKYRIRQNTVDVTTSTGRSITLRHDRVLPSGFRTINVGISLSVIPSVGSDRKTIALTLIPEVIEHVDWNEFVNVAVGNAEGTALERDRWTVKTPIFFTRNVTTSILVDDGETVVIGGLIKENETERTDRVPYLSNIPILGYMFKRTYYETEKTNLLIFVTSHILTPAGKRYAL